MKGSPAVPGGPLTSKPTRFSTFRVLSRVGFFTPTAVRNGQPAQIESSNGSILMGKSTPTQAQEIAEAVITFQQQTTGHTPKAVTVVLSEDTLVITLHEALSPAEKNLARSREGAAQVEEFHRQLFSNSSQSLREEIKRITGVEVREAVAEVEPTTGTVVQAFTRSAMVQVFRLAQSVPGDSWSGSDPGNL